MRVIRCEVFGGVNAALEAAMESVLSLIQFAGRNTNRIVFIENWNCDCQLPVLTPFVRSMDNLRIPQRASMNLRLY
jgi:hypothetical protein